MTALNTVILDTLEPEVTFVPDSVVIYVPGGAWLFDNPTNTLTLTLGTVDPMDYPDRIIAYYEIETLYSDPGKVQILSSEYSYDDPWTTGINFAGSACQDISVVKELHLEKSTDVSYLPITPTTPRTRTMTASSITTTWTRTATRSPIPWSCLGTPTATAFPTSGTMIRITTDCSTATRSSLAPTPTIPTRTATGCGTATSWTSARTP